MPYHLLSIETKGIVSGCKLDERNMHRFHRVLLRLLWFLILWYCLRWTRYIYIHNECVICSVWPEISEYMYKLLLDPMRELFNLSVVLHLCCKCQHCPGDGDRVSITASLMASNFRQWRNLPKFIGHTLWFKCPYAYRCVYFYHAYGRLETDIIQILFLLV